MHIHKNLLKKIFFKRVKCEFLLKHLNVIKNSWYLILVNRREISFLIKN